MRVIRTASSALLFAFCAFTTTTLVPASARACGDEWYPTFQVDPRVKGTGEAEDALDQGQPLAAAGFVIRMIPHIRQLDVTKAKIVQRAGRVLALSTARYGGALPVAREVPSYAWGGWLGRTEAERHANLTWAAKTLRAVAALRMDDPAAKTELAEALARLPETRSEARDILEALAQRDLITSAEGYATLASLRELAGDDAGKRAALDRCKAMSGGAKACASTNAAT